jgi:hypothetical protein
MSRKCCLVSNPFLQVGDNSKSDQQQQGRANSQKVLAEAGTHSDSRACPDGSSGRQAMGAITGTFHADDSRSKESDANRDRLDDGHRLETDRSGIARKASRCSESERNEKRRRDAYEHVGPQPGRLLRAFPLPPESPGEHKRYNETAEQFELLLKPRV